ncbi:vWA domain-containing protein [Roseovarius salinarum]|uniref:vWA domain-containing protein n=1 Tax=Roseovarius salinarum TaxID=1981892 RepID=UPI001E3693CD|nr:vWA domain-containing protein [Roseovarius salinarum]
MNRARRYHLAGLAGLLALATGWGPPAHRADASPECARDAMLVFDGSASMGEIGHDPSRPTRIEEARAAMRRAMPRITPYRRVGLLVYGPGGADACSGIDLRFAPAPDAAGALIGAIGALAPGGLTPLAASVRAAARTLEYRERPGIVVLVTDGNETCGGRPCALGGALAASARDLTVHVVGFRVVQDPFSWNSPEADSYDGQTVAKCLADRTGGLYVSTDTVDELAQALRVTLGCALIGRAQDVSGRSG